MLEEPFRSEEPCTSLSHEGGRGFPWRPDRSGLLSACRRTAEYIRGDLDSVLPHVTDYYTSRGTKLVKDTDQVCSGLLLSSPCVHSASEHAARCAATGHDRSGEVHGASPGVGPANTAGLP